MGILSRLYSRMLMECAGTALLSFTVYRASQSELTGLEQSLLVGLCVALLVHILGRYSGAHLNPAITIIFYVEKIGRDKALLLKHFREAGGYVVSQVIGSMAGISLAQLGHHVQTVQRLDGFVEETLLTVVLLSLVMTWSKEGKLCPFSQPLTGMVIGGGVTYLAALGGLTSSGVFNPAISLGLTVSSKQQGMESMIAAQMFAVLIVAIVIRIHQSLRRY